MTSAWTTVLNYSNLLWKSDNCQSVKAIGRIADRFWTTYCLYNARTAMCQSNMCLVNERCQKIDSLRLCWLTRWPISYTGPMPNPYKFQLRINFGHKTIACVALSLIGLWYNKVFVYTETIDQTVVSLKIILFKSL